MESDKMKQKTELAQGRGRRKEERKEYGKIYFVMGKSASGKDTVYKKLLERIPELKTIIPYTTRPMREGETEGAEYHFTDEASLQEMWEMGKVIEKRTYHTVYGPWSYATVDDGQIDLREGSILMIGTLESYQSIRSYFGGENTVPLYIEVEDGERLERALNREKRQKYPRYAELCRRFLADEEDFSEEKLSKAGIIPEDRYENQDLEQCLNDLAQRITGSEDRRNEKGGGLKRTEN